MHLPSDARRQDAADVLPTMATIDAEVAVQRANGPCSSQPEAPPQVAHPRGIRAESPFHQMGRGVDESGFQPCVLRAAFSWGIAPAGMNCAFGADDSREFRSALLTLAFPFSPTPPGVSTLPPAAAWRRRTVSRGRSSCPSSRGRGGTSGDQACRCSRARGRLSRDRRRRRA